MKSIPVSKARLRDVFEFAVESRQPVRLTSHNSSAIVVSWEQWHAIEETLHRLSDPAPVAPGRGRPARNGAHVRA
jgi:PHD/YefM family antitoxin component YafN of YafNO toxin-antitoxin module